MRRLLTLLLVTVLAGCSEPEPSKPQIALVMKSLANEFFATMAQGAEAHQSTHAAVYDLIVNGIKDERDLSRQVALVDEMVARGVDAIVIAPADSKALVPVLRRAFKAGVVVVNIDNKLDADVLAEQDLSIPFVGPDNRAGARSVGNFLANQLNAGDKVVVLEGTRSSFNAQQRKLGFEDAMSAGGIEIVDSQSANWEIAPANTIMSAMLTTHQDIVAVLAANDNMALGALAAVKASGREGDVQIVGFDNISAVQNAIRAGEILATADQHADQLAVFGIEAALDLLEAPHADVADVQTPVDLVTQDTL